MPGSRFLAMDSSERSQSSEHCSPPNGLKRSDWLFSSSTATLSLRVKAIPPRRTPDKDVKSEEHINESDPVTHQKVRIDQISFLSVCSLNYSTSSAHYPSFFADCVSRETTEHLTNAEVTGLREIHPWDSMKYVLSNSEQKISL